MYTRKRNHPQREWTWIAIFISGVTKTALNLLCLIMDFPMLLCFRFPFHSSKGGIKERQFTRHLSQQTLDLEMNKCFLLKSWASPAGIHCKNDYCCLLAFYLVLPKLNRGHTASESCDARAAHYDKQAALLACGPLFPPLYLNSRPAELVCKLFGMFYLNRKHFLDGQKILGKRPWRTNPCQSGYTILC